ncbi:hypothetical protein CI102_8038 [Trichoderma harzianum]|nr:hypothetical protein CI102_8038 [Trichoderma harzianum]
MTDRDTRLAGRSGETPRSFLGSKQEDRAPSESQKAAPRKKKPVLPGLARKGRALAGRLKWAGWALALALARGTYRPSQHQHGYRLHLGLSVSTAAHLMPYLLLLLGTCCLVSPISPHVSHAPAFQLPYQRLPSPMQSAFVSSLVAITRRWAPGHTAPAFRSVSQQGALEASETTKTSASFADGWPSPAFRFAGSATCLGLGESESSNRWVSLVASLLFPVLPRPLEKGC